MEAEVMIQAMETSLDVMKIIVEPGDLTRYEFYVYPDYRFIDEFFIMLVKRSFQYPQHLNKWDIAGTIYLNKWDIADTIEKCMDLIGMEPPYLNVTDHFKEFDYANLKNMQEDKKYACPFEAVMESYQQINKYAVMAVHFSIYDVFQLNKL